RRPPVHGRPARPRTGRARADGYPVVPRLCRRVDGPMTDNRAATGSSAPTVAIIGRPNVGKSTLFNRLIGRRTAIVDDRPGVTRDRNFASADWNGRRFWLVDTGGLVPGASDSISRAVRLQVEAAVAESDV